MCGLFGIVENPGWSVERARQARDRLHHRGPDQSGEWVSDQVYIGHRRLSIIDTSDSGRQPMEAGQVVIAANGEIYNFEILRKELERSHRFASRSDSETLLHGYREWGLSGLLERIDGMFAFVIYDAALRKLYLVRDRPGIKPLYYRITDSGIVWASELKAINAYVDSVSQEVDYSGIYDFLTYGYIPAPKTLYKGVYKLRPASYVDYDLDSRSFTVKSYWSLPVGHELTSLEKSKWRLRELVRASVEEQLVSDVPLGCFLSGGIDSSVLVSEAASVVDKLQTFSVSFDFPSHDESRFADVVARHFATQHQVTRFSQEELDSIFSGIRNWYDEPFADLSAWPTFFVSKFARASVTVALSGDGGDEIFGGYNRYARAASIQSSINPIFQLIRKLVRPGADLYKGHGLIDRFRRRLDLYAADPLELYTRLMSGLLSHEKTEFADYWEIPADYDDYWYFREFYRPDLPLRTRFQYIDFHTYLPDDILTKTDRASMAVSLEARVPFLSRQLIEFAFSIDERIRYASNELKGLLKFAYGGVLPESILNRGKKGFSIPSTEYLHGFSMIGESPQEMLLRHFGELDLAPIASQ